jgi:colicin import membrane protein
MESLFVISLLLAIVALIAGLIRPAMFTKIFKRELTRKNVLVYFGGATIAFFVLLAIFSEPSTAPKVEQEVDRAVVEQQQEGSQEVEDEKLEEEATSQPEPTTETSTTETTPQPQTQQPPPQQQIQPEPEPEQETQQTESEPISDGKKWYISSHWSSEYYYCEESDEWKGLSETYLRVYDSESALLADYPNHTLHESCQ